MPVFRLRFLAAWVLVASAALARSPPTPFREAAATPTPADLATADREALAKIRELLAGREQEPAEKVFKNIDLLRGKPASRLPGMMSALTGLIGVGCPVCHVPGNFSSDELPAKRTARLHFAMQSALNRDYFAGANGITCFTCHRGQRKPAAL